MSLHVYRSLRKPTETRKMKAILIAVFSILLSTPLCRAEEPENPLKGTPFEDKWEELKGMNGHISTKREVDNSDAYVNAAKKFSRIYIRLIEEFQLYDELDIDEHQREKLNAVVNPTEGSVAELFGDGRTLFEVDRKTFDRWLHEKWSPLMTRYCKISNDAVEEILSKEQIHRLKEIGFQYHTMVHNHPIAAYRMHQVELDPAKSGKLAQQLIRARSTARLASRYLAFRERCEIVAERVGRTKLEQATGKLISFDPKFDASVVHDLLPPDREESENPRRGVQ